VRIVLFACPGPIGRRALEAVLAAGHEVAALVLKAGSGAAGEAASLAIARSRGIRTMRPVGPADPAFVAAVREMAPDLLVVATFDRRLPRRLIAAARWGGVNLHTSLLPDYRGACPEFWAIRNGDERTGVTVHALDARLDAGPIIAQEPIAIDRRETLGTLLAKAAEAGAPLLARVLAEIEARGEPLPGEPQPPRCERPAPLVREADLRIDWGRPAAEIERLVRAANPLAAAWTLFRGDPLLLLYARASDGAALAPGALRLDERGRLTAGTGDGGLRILALRWADRLACDGATFAAVAGLTEGERCA
jgi:methionyl-tRNA formyltransferase